MSHPQIIYEDKYIIALNKPSGLITHPKDAKDQSDSISGWVFEHRPELKGIGEYSDRPGMMHRLDKDTSGLILIAKDQKTFDYLKHLFQSRKIAKTYLALVKGHPKKDSGVIDAPIGRIGLKRTTLAKNGKLRDEKTASTEYKVVEKYKDFSLLEVSPKTGRTHQIRVHMKHIGHPVAGDELYGLKDWNKSHGPERLFLHAFKLRFTSPEGTALTIQADLPPELESFLKYLPK